MVPSAIGVSVKCLSVSNLRLPVIRLCGSVMRIGWAVQHRVNDLRQAAEKPVGAVHGSFFLTISLARRQQSQHSFRIPPANTFMLEGQESSILAEVAPSAQAASNKARRQQIEADLEQYSCLSV